MVGLRGAAPALKAALSALASGSAVAKYLASKAEAEHPPIGEFLSLGGARLHYLDRGSGVPIVLLHGNASMIADFLSSGIVERLAAAHRVIAFDRPGFGYSERPRGRAWTPAAQAELLLGAFAQLGIERPIVVAHSWGALVGLALGLASPQSVGGLVLLSGYYYPSPCPDAVTMTQAAAMLGTPAAPLVGMAAASAVRRVFAPCAVPGRFKLAYPLALALRPSQIEAAGEEAAMLVDAAEALSRRYAELDVPLHLIAGAEDRIVTTERHSARLHRQLPRSTFRCVPGSGHMVHHAAPEEVAAAVAAMCGARGELSSGRRPASPAARRRWLRIGECSVDPQRAFPMA
jgi:pimeloyl-ACP methyl ester carboxylesterase